MPDCAGTSFTNVIYTKLSTFPSIEIFRIMDLFSTASNKNGNLQNNQYGYPPLADYQLVAAKAAAAAGQAYRSRSHHMRHCPQSLSSTLSGIRFL